MADPRRPLVLVVDDDPEVRGVLADILGADYDVVPAADGAEAVALLPDHRVDVVLLDLVMPEMGGLATLARVRQIDPTVGIVMLTAVDTARTARDALKLGAVDYLTKPFTCDGLRAAVRSAMVDRWLGARVD